MLAAELYTASNCFCGPVHFAGQSVCLPSSPSTFPLVVHNLFWKFPCTSEVDVNLAWPIGELRMGVEWKLVLFTRITQG